jgi:oxepin-CoA hydrolase/3-oxo-5,6-dehydrosuberyl-CoA semialdehyde dehydrogenase
MKVDITNRKELNELLNTLTEDTLPKWGVMRPQNMVEHLALVTEHTNGKRIAAQRTTEDEAKAAKQIIIYSDAEIPQGLKSPLAGEGADPFRFSNLDEAKQDLNKQLDDFETYFKRNPSATPVQPRFGPLTYNEWVILHNKHFTHHFKQFGLM